MFDDAKDFFEDIAEEVTEELDEFKEKIEEALFEKLPALIDKWDFDSRNMTTYEITEAKKVFGETLDYDDIRIFSGTELPNFIDDIGRFIKKIPKRDERIKNAITLGNWVFFGRDLDTSTLTDMSWMIHELTHVWQFQSMGWDYLFQALDAQKKLGAKAYDFGGEEGLKAQRKRGRKLREFNLEQQGDITRNYYQKLAKGEDTKAWGKYIQEVKGKSSADKARPSKI